MNMQKYLIPATSAAVFHVALLFGLPREAFTTIKKYVEIPLPNPPPKKAEDLPLPPPPDSSDPVDPVKTLASSPTPPTLPEPLPDVRQVDWAPADPLPSSEPIKHLIKIPGNIGIGNGPDDGNGPVNPIFSVVKLDWIPRAKVQIPPDYPSTLRNAGITGTVNVEFEVDTKGTVVKARAVSSSRTEFEAAAIRAVLKWRFEPGR